MSRIPAPISLQVPATLAEQLHQFRRRVWTKKLLEAVATAIAALAVGYLAVFVSDRLWDSPPWLRGTIALVAIGACAIVPYYLHRWVWRYRQLTQLARLLSRRLPRIGDQLLGVIELAENKAPQAHSQQLCEAAIQQVAEDAKHRDFREALPPSREKTAMVMATGTLVVAGVLLVLFPLAARNAWSRMIEPWGDTPRYTFAAVLPLPNEIVVAHGEPFEMRAALDPNSQWKPDKARLELGQRELTADNVDGAYRFEAPAQIAATSARLVIGDWSQQVRIEPKVRPELTALRATVELPSYLGRPEPQQLDIRGGTASMVKGSRATFAATASRPLSTATADGAAITTSGANLTVPAFEVTEPRDIMLSWTDEFNLAGTEPLKLSVTADEDQPPTLMCEGLPRKKVVLDSEQLDFQVSARDDFGLSAIGMEWKGASDGLVTPAKGEQQLLAGGHDKTTLEARGTFCATSLGIEPQPVEVRIFATDYFPNRERVYSTTYTLYVLSAEQHAIWITEQLARWHRQSLEVRDHELKLFETNKQLRELSAEELDLAETRKQIETQAAAEKSNARRLDKLTTAGEELLRQAARNPEIGVGHLDRWAEMLQILDNIAANRMPSVANLLDEGAKAQPGASQMASKQGPKAGQSRNNAAGAGEAKPTGPKPAVPTLTDSESQQQPSSPTEAKEEENKTAAKPSGAKFGLPTTTLAGKPSAGGKKPPSQSVDQAVVEQQALLAEFEKIANELNQIMGNLEGSTLVKRLKAESRKQYQISGKIGEQISDAFGDNSPGGADDPGVALGGLSDEIDTGGYTVSLIMDDMQAYFERRHLAKFKAVLDDMRKEDVLGGLRRLSDEVPGEPGTSIAQCEFWSDTMDRWAEDLVDASNCGACPGCRAKGCLPPSIVLEVLQILEGEINLRDETRVVEQRRTALESVAYGEESNRLSSVQEQLQQRIIKVVERILELPDARADFGKELQLLSEVDRVMQETTEILATPQTGATAIAAETEAIELLLKSRRINPKGGGGGGANPGGGGTGTTQDSALALLGAGLNEKEIRQAPNTQQAVGTTGETLPEEFRAGLDEYFNQLETAVSHE